LTYNYTADKLGITAWAGFLQQTSEDASDNNGDDVDSEGVSYGVQFKYDWLTLHASGFDAKGVGFLLGPGVDNTLGLPLADADGEIDTNGYLLQAALTFGPHRLVASYGKNKVEPDDSADWEDETATGAYFYTFNDYLKVCAEYNQNKVSIGDAEETTDTIALGGIISF